MEFPFKPAARSGPGRAYEKLDDETDDFCTVPAQEKEGPAKDEQEEASNIDEATFPALTADVLGELPRRDPFELMQEGNSLKGSSVAASEDLPDLLPVRNRDHTNVSVVSTISDLRSGFCSQGSGSSLWSGGSLARDVKPAAEASDEAMGGATASTDPGDPLFEDRMSAYQKRRASRLQKKKSRQTPSYGDFLGKCANSKHSEDALSISFEVRGILIDQLEPLSQGSFARVYKGVWNGESHGYGPETLVAVKCMRTRWSTKYVSSGGTEHMPTWLEREVQVCKTFTHPNLVLCYLVAVDVAPYILVLEYCSGGSLSGLLDDLRGSGLQAPYLERFSWRQRLKVCLDVADGVLYLHSRQVVHRDLKPQNILLVRAIKTTQDEAVAKVGDFGLARSLAQECDSKFLSHQVGSWEHMAPEVVDVEANQDYDEKVDVYSLALIMYELASGRWPFSGMDELHGDGNKIARFVVKGGRPVWDAVPEAAPTIFLSLIPLAWSQTPSERPALDSIVQKLHAARAELPADEDGGEGGATAAPGAETAEEPAGTPPTAPADAASSSSATAATAREGEHPAGGGGGGEAASAASAEAAATGKGEGQTAEGSAPRPLDLDAFREGLRDALLSPMSE